VLGVYLLDLGGLHIVPAAMAVFGATVGAGLLWRIGRSASWDGVELAAFLLIVGGVFAWMMWLAAPLFLPLGGGDQTHHLLLIQYIERHWQLAHPVLWREIGELAFYTPGAHILIALVGAWARSDGFHVMHATGSLAVALKAGFVFLIARRMLTSGVPRTPLAMIGALALFASPTFLVQSWFSHGFVAQVICEWLAVAMWWALIVWDQDQRWEVMALVSLLGIGVFLTWPILLGPPLVVLAALVVLSSPDTFAERLRAAVWSVMPIALLAIMFTFGRARYLTIVGARGVVDHPALHAYSWWFLPLSSAGILVSLIDLLRSVVARGAEVQAPIAKATTPLETRTLAIIVIAILAQAATFAAGSWWLGREPYMRDKMFYLLLSAQAVGVALAGDWLWRRAFNPARTRWANATGWVFAPAMLLVVAIPLKGMRQQIYARPPAASLPLYEAGQWARDHVPVQCVDYAVPTTDTAYWLHLVVLGNPRRVAADGKPQAGIVPSMLAWPHRSGEPYAIADLAYMTDDVRGQFELLAQFDTAAVLKRREPAACRPPSD